MSWSRGTLQTTSARFNALRAQSAAVRSRREPARGGQAGPFAAWSARMIWEARAHWVLFAALALVLVGCPETRTLTIDLQTDLVPELELGSVEISVLPRFVPHEASAVPVQTLTLEPSAEQAAGLRTGLRVMEVTGLDAGTYTIRAVARRPVPSGTPLTGGTFLGHRDVVTMVDSSRVVRVVLVGSCGGVSCPGMGDADRATECLNGECVDPRCEPVRPETAEYCCDGPTCAEDARCTTASDCVVAPCADPTCVDGACIAIDRGECGPGAYCDLTAGECLTVSGASLRDAGAPDAGPPGDADPLLDACPLEICGNGVDDDCDGTLDCEDTECRGVACDDDDPCTDEDVCVPDADPACVGTLRECADDANECTMDVCTATSCTHTPVDDSVPCTDDGNECTSDLCTAGACAHPPIAGFCADDGNECTIDLCHMGGCTHTPRSHRDFFGDALCAGGICCSGSCIDPLTDAAHCGVCNVSCAAGRACVSGQCGCGGFNDCRPYGYGPMATCNAGGCECQCAGMPVDATCLGECPAGTVCHAREGSVGPNRCEYPAP